MIKQLRKKRGLSLKQIKEMTGLSESYVNRLEKGERNCPTYPVIEQLAIVLDVEPTDLLEAGYQRKNDSITTLEQLLYLQVFTIDGTNVISTMAVEKLLDLIDLIYNVSWQNETLISDIYEVTESVNEFKQALNA